MAALHQRQGGLLVTGRNQIPRAAAKAGVVSWASMKPELGSGPLDAGLWLVGRDFGAEEQHAQQPFVGPAGHVLDAVLRAAGVDRASVRVDNLVPEQPLVNDFAAHSPAALAAGQARLRALLARYRPSVIVAFGNEVGKFLLGDAWPTGEGVQDIRGYLWDTPFGRVLTSVHPAAILRDWAPWRALLDLDLRRAVNEWRNDCPPLAERNVTIVTQPAELEGLYDERGGDGLDATGEPRRAYAGNNVVLGDAKACGGFAVGMGATLDKQGCSVRDQQYTVTGCPLTNVAPPVPRSCRKLGWLAVDIENTEDRRLACVGFAASPERAFVIPAHEPWQLDAIRALCESEAPKVLQNGQYDRFFLERFAGITLRNQVFDTQLAWHALQPELAGKKTQTKKRAYGRRTVKSLKFLASIYTRDRWWKDYAFASEEERYILCGRDCCVTLEIAKKQARQLEVT